MPFQVGLMVYGLMGSSPSREDRAKHLLMLRHTEINPTTTTKERSTSTTPSHIVQSEISHEDTSIQSDVGDDISQEPRSLPYRRIPTTEDTDSEQGIMLSSSKHGRNAKANAFVNEGPSTRFHRVDTYPVYWIPPLIVRSEPVIQSRIMNNINYQIPRPFMTRNLTAERLARNRIKVFKNDPQTALPYYGFASPSKYAQLSSYRYPSEAKNIQDIIKYLTTDDSNKSSPSNKKQETVAFPVPVANGRRIKFSGVYKTAVRDHPEENHVKPEESVEDSVTSSHQKMMSDPSLNGHAYIADPFHAFKPSDPSEVNLLANSDFRFSPFDNRIRFPTNRPHRNRWGVLEINPNDKYFPRPPINFGKPSAPSPSISENHDPVVQTYPGTYTSAIYRPFGKEPSTTTPHSSTKTANKMKPFSVMLDIYPMMEESVLQTSSGPYKLQPRPMTRPDHGLGHHVRFSQGVNQERFPEQLTDSESKHQMVVHLNLYPKTKKNHKFGNRSVLVQQKSFLQ
ncbi:hypothetical protein L798_14904 [Zootermopsis nevadensis]|uniref:Uncharacterized protein n=1 Tax=Zootermopsis nevadensis TaxID=136037 RepID=A0A067QXE6_ZOONE|nr:hypothetical protein L798_14904 [Zootermopsis nevadensis]